jgi:hypothetical protein
VLSTRCGPSTIFLFNFQSPHTVFAIITPASYFAVFVALIYYFNMFRRALTTLKITFTKNNEISSLEASVVDECIAELTNKIFELEDRKNNIRQYISLALKSRDIYRHLHLRNRDNCHHSQVTLQLQPNCLVMSISFERLSKSC